MVCFFRVILISLCLSTPVTVARRHEITRKSILEGRESILNGVVDPRCYWYLPREFLLLTQAAVDNKVSIGNVRPRLSLKFRESATVREVTEKIWNPLYGTKITNAVIKAAIEKNKDPQGVDQNFFLGLDLCPPGVTCKILIISCLVYRSIRS